MVNFRFVEVDDNFIKVENGLDTVVGLTASLDGPVVIGNQGYSIVGALVFEPENTNYDVYAPVKSLGVNWESLLYPQDPT